MKKLLAILLALILVLVNVAALAADGNTGYTSSTKEVMVERLEDGNWYYNEDNTRQYTGIVYGDDGEVIDNQGNNPTGSSTSPTNTDTPTDEDTFPTKYLPDAPGDEFSNKETISGEKTLNNEANVTVTLDKAIQVEGYNNTGKAPAQYITFAATYTGVEKNSVTVAANTVPTVTFSPVSLNAETTTAPVTLTVGGAFPAVGVYMYDVAETVVTKERATTGVAGVTAASGLKLRITVIQGENGLKIAGVALRQAEIKTDEIENLFESGALDITKTVTGNMGDRTLGFDFTVVFTSSNGTVMSDMSSTGAGTIKDGDLLAGENGWTEKTIVVTLSHGQTFEIDNIPAGVTYTVTETKPNEYEQTETSGLTGTIASKDIQHAAITNNYSEDIDTGVALETLPYVLMMALSVIGLAVLFVRKREEY